MLLIDDVRSIIINNKSHIVLAGVAIMLVNQSNFSDETMYTQIYELDTAGNQLNYVLGTDTNGPSPMNMLATNDGGYVISGWSFCYRDTAESKWLGSIAKLDSNFHKVWIINTGPCSQSTGFNGLVKSPDGNYIAVGSSYNDIDTPYTHINGFIGKYSDDGQIIWNRLYRGLTSDGYNGDENILSTICFLSDNSIVTAGEAANYDDTSSLQQYGWILHLDTAGCLPDSNSCGIPDGIKSITQESARVLVYPNPASDNLTIEVISNCSPANITICNLLGQAMYQNTSTGSSSSLSIDVYTWPTSLYYYTLSLSDGFIASGSFVVSH